jgi:sugar transferase (PEP-CTERM/EpsH1 system associated)
LSSASDVKKDRLRILFVVPDLPYPLTWGFGIRVYQLMSRLAERHDISLLAHARPGEADKVRALQQVCSAVYTVPMPRPRGGKRLAQALASVSPHSYQGSWLRSPHMRRAIRELTSRQQWDLLQVESSKLCPLDVPRAIPLLLDEHNVEYELLYRTFREERSAFRRAFAWLEYQKFRREEQRSWQWVDGCILTSDREASILRQHSPRTPAVVVPNGVDLDYFRPSSAALVPDHLVFTGLLSYRPNADAVIWFVNEILPLIRRVRPAVVFTVAGASAPPEVLRLAGANVAITGRVPDVRPYVLPASVAVVPLRMGSGTRLKVLEGLAMGKAVVSTSVGCEGIAVRDGEHLLVADQPEQFARRVLELLDDPRRRSILGTAGRALVERDYSWESVSERLERFYVEQLSARVHEPIQSPLGWATHQS